jgi:hypothetical protein
MTTAYVEVLQPTIGDYVIPDGWPNGIGGLLETGMAYVDESFLGSPFCIKGQFQASPIRVDITGRTVNYRKFSRPAMRCKIEWIKDGEPSDHSHGWIVSNS